MHLLALETSTLRASLAVQKSDGIRELCATDPSQRHGRELLPAIEAMLQRVNVSAKNLDVIAVGLGPGSYTGLRVGVTAAKTLAYAIGAKLVGLDGRSRGTKRRKTGTNSRRIVSY